MREGARLSMRSRGGMPVAFHRAIDDSELTSLPGVPILPLTVCCSWSGRGENFEPRSRKVFPNMTERRVLHRSVYVRAGAAS